LLRRVLPALPGEAGVDRLVAFIEGLCHEARAMGIPVRGVGVAVPSVTDFDRGVVAWVPWLGWRNLPLKRRLEDALGLPVFVENEVNVLALGERWRGAGQGRRDLACLSLTTGIGAGLILDGQLYRGPHHASGEVGYMLPGLQYLGNTYNTLGCLEGLAGGSGIVRRAAARLAAGEHSSLLGGNGEYPEPMGVESVLSAARDGDPLARAVVDETIDYLGLAIINLVCVLDPELVIITGELADFGDLLVDPIRQRIQGAIPMIPEIVLSELRMDAAVLGAVSIVLSETSGAVSVQSERA
jgi:glucokinase